jgi:hypothetical protein
MAEPEAKPPRRRRRARRKRIARWVVALVFSVGLLVGLVGSAFVLLPPAQTLVVETALDRLRSGLAGDLVVEDMRSGNLLEGATLYRVRLDAGGGRRFLSIDSLRLRYAWFSLLSSRPRLASVTAWGPRVEISRYHGEDRPNVAGLVVERAVPDSARSTFTLGIGQVRIERGELDVLTPLSGPPSAGVPTEEAPDGSGALRRLTLGEVTLELADARLDLTSPDLLVGELTELAMQVGVLERPLLVTGGEGQLLFGDAGLRLAQAELRFPGSAFEGGLQLGPGVAGAEAWGFSLDLQTLGPAALADLGWLDERIPDGLYRGGIGVSVGNTLRVDFDDVQTELEASRFALDGSVDVDNGPVLRALQVTASPLSVARLQPWVTWSLPVDGWISGRVSLSGRPSSLATDGRLTLVPLGYGGGPTTADFAGTLHLGRNPGVSSFHATVEPLSMELLARLTPSLRVEGAGRARVDASGRVEDGVRFTADLAHPGSAGDGTRLLLGGSMRRDAEDGWLTDVQADLAPLSLDLLAGFVPALGLHGFTRGSARARGRLEALRVTGELAVGAGTGRVDATVNVLDPSRDYRIHARLEGVRLDRLASRLPEPSMWNGELDVMGSGFALDSLEARGRVSAVASRVGGLHVDSLSAALSAGAGVVTVDTMGALLGGVNVEGSGRLGLQVGHGGTARLTFSTRSLVGLRPIFLGDTVYARDELSVLEGSLLRAQGVDPDTLPLAADVAMDGEAFGFVELSGSVDSLAVTGETTLRLARYGRDAVDSAFVRFDARDATSADRTVGLEITAEGLEVRGRAFAQVGADLTMRGRSGEGHVTVQRRSDERYDLRGSFALDSLGGRADIGEATLEIGEAPWRLERPATISWAPQRIQLGDVEMTRVGDDPMRMTASGALDWAGSSDLTLQARGLHLERVARVAQLEDVELAGHLDLDLSVTGPAAAPTIRGSFRVLEPRYGTLQLSELSGELDYAEQVARVRVDALHGDRRVFEAAGTVPVDLALDAAGNRSVARPMDVDVRADSLDASLALGFLDFLQGVRGVVSGDFHLGGTVDQPEPSGVLQLADGAWAIEELGVAHRDIQGTLTLDPQGVVEVDVRGAAGEGESTITGTVRLQPANDPRLDLDLSFADFEALARRDVEGHISGTLHLDSTYSRPLVTGELTVDHGNLFLEEFQRSSEIVDLTDPRFFTWGIVDTLALSTRPLLAGIRNPFFDNLRVAVDLSVPRDTWLRSEEMNVEIGGQLLVTYDRLNRDLVMVGELEALRGQYFVLNRRFEVQGGTVGFIGTPGINPTLDIQAVASIRRGPGEPALEVNATVSGTLTQPRVTLGSEEQGLSESDLVSYLIFGRPSYLLAGGQSALVQGAAGSLLRSTAGVGVTYLTGAVANQIGAAFAQQLGIDYLSFTQSSEQTFGVLSGSLAGSQLEVGRYLTEDLFVVLIVRPPDDDNSTRFGARVEVAVSNDVSVQGFWEDRFLRSRVGGFSNLSGFDTQTVIGVFVFREWGY